MNNPFLAQRCFEFSFPQLDTLVRVEESAGDVIIRATRDTFSEARKLCFVRELAAEGFIPEEYRWFALSGCESIGSLRWVVDFSWLKLDAAQTAHTRRIMIRLIGAAALFWLVQMSALL